MKKLVLGLIAMLALPILPMQIQAAEYHQPGHYYLPITFGMYRPQTSSGLASSPILNVGLGYNFTPVFSVQALVGAFSPEDTTNNNTPGAVLMRAEGLFHMPTQYPLQPYAGIGFGWEEVRSGEFLVDFALGTEYHISPNTALTFNWRYIKLTADNQSDYMLTGGLTYAFGATETIAQQHSQLSSAEQKTLARAKAQLKPYLPQGVRLCSGDQLTDDSGCVTIDGNEVTMRLYVQFDLAKSNIRWSYRGPIDRLARFMKAYPHTEVKLKGYASSEGTLKFNQRLSNNRAESVRQYLINKGIDANRLDAVGYGISDPLASNKTQSGREMNRRVQATVTVPLQQSSRD